MAKPIDLQRLFSLAAGDLDERGFERPEIELQAVETVLELEKKLSAETRELEALLSETAALGDVRETAVFFHDKVLSKMKEIRAAVDELEGIVADDYWPVPTYGDILFSVK